MSEQMGMINQEEIEVRKNLSEARQALQAGKDLLSMVNELAAFLQEFEGELIELSNIKLHDMANEQRKKVQRWLDAVVVRVDLREGDAVEIQTDVFGLLRAMSIWSTSSRRH
jgi:hypothetical protein